VFCSGAPDSTHYMGQMLFIAPRSEWQMVDGSWGELLGLKGSGSHTLRFDRGHVPMEHCPRAAEEGVPYTFGADLLVGCIAREVMVLAWETMQADFSYREVAKERLGIPRERLGQQRALSGRAVSQSTAA
jgi:hypothetical protein